MHYYYCYRFFLANHIAPSSVKPSEDTLIGYYINFFHFLLIYKIILTFPNFINYFSKFISFLSFNSIHPLSQSKFHPLLQNAQKPP